MSVEKINDYDWVTVNGQVLSRDGDNLKVRIKDRHGHAFLVIDAEEVTKIEPPVPDEPDRNALLKSTRGGRIFTYGPGLGWYMLGSNLVANKYIDWPELYATCGPFVVFESTKMIGC